MITEKNDTTFSQSSGEIFRLTVFLFLIIFLATRLGTFIHEFFGHGLAAIIVGGEVSGMSIDLFATGYCEYELTNSELIYRAFVGLAGMAANFVSGIAAFVMATKWRLPWECRVMLCLFAAISVCSQLVYLVVGTYYNYGDPIVLEELLGSAKWLVWAFALILVAPSSYYFAQSYLRLQNEWTPSNSPKDRLIKLFSTLAVASLVYAACYWVEGGTTGFLGGMAASEQKITRIAQKAAGSQELTEGEKTILIERIKKALRPFPIIIPTLLIAFVSGLKAFWNARHGPVVPAPHNLRIAYLCWSLFLSLLVGGLIIFLYR
jgi:hypothetical protein